MKLVWLRRDLRIEDNTALTKACESEESVVVLYISTPSSWADHSLAPIQADLIYRRLFELQSDLRGNNIRLYYAQTDTFTDASKLVAELAEKEHVSGVYMNKEYELNEKTRDNYLVEQLAEKGIECHQYDDKCALVPGSVVNKQGDYFKVFTPFKRAYLEKLYRHPIQITQIHPLSECAEVSSDLVSEFSTQCCFDYPRRPSDSYPVATKQVINSLREFDRSKVELYQKQRDFPAIEGTSSLSPYFAIGVLSVRQCLARVMYTQALPLTGGREVWQSELIWREFYQHLSYFESKLSMGKSFTPWGDNLVWHNSEQAISAWKNGETGYPIVDAAMRQLNQTGWMHNRLRMIVASFLVKDLHVDWRIGEQYFMSQLVDGEYSANNGGWQWCASTGCDGQPYFRIFNPITQGERFDVDGEFVRRWIPELSEVPTKYIHQPWKWIDSDRLSYPKPIVDHKAEREITLSLYKQAKEV